MLLECLQALQRLREASPPRAIRHTAQVASNSAPAVTQKLAYDVDATRRLVLRPWAPHQLELLRQHFHTDPEVLDTSTWLAALRVLLDSFVPTSTDWQEIAFRLWARRVLTYSETIEGVRYEEAMRYLREMVRLSASS